VSAHAAPPADYDVVQASHPAPRRAPPGTSDDSDAIGAAGRQPPQQRSGAPPRMTIRVPCASCQARLRFDLDPTELERQCEATVKARCPRCSKVLAINFKRHLRHHSGAAAANTPPPARAKGGGAQTMAQTASPPSGTVLCKLEEECMRIALLEQSPGKAMPAFVPKSRLAAGQQLHQLWLPIKCNTDAPAGVAGANKVVALDEHAAREHYELKNVPLTNKVAPGSPWGCSAETAELVSQRLQRARSSIHSLGM